MFVWNCVLLAGILGLAFREILLTSNIVTTTTTTTTAMANDLMQIVMTLTAIMALAFLCLIAAILVFGLWMLKNALDDEVRRRAKDADSLTARSQELEDRSGGKLGAISDVTALEQRYRALSGRLLALTASSSPLESSAKPAFAEEVLVARVNNAVLAGAPPPSPPSSTPPPLSPRTTSLGPSPDEYLQALRRLLHQAEKLRAGIEEREGGRGERPLSAVVVEANETERADLAHKMKTQDQQVADIRDSLTELESHRDSVMLMASQEEAANIRVQIEALRSEWSRLSDAHSSKMAKWHRAMEQWRTVDSGTKDITNWLQTAEGKLSTARNTLDPKEADALYKELEVSLRQHQGHVTRMNSAGEEILQGTTALSANRLREKLELINHRWKVLCSEVLTRQKRSMKENSVEPSEFTTEMDDLFSWIDEAENILTSSLRPDLLYLEALLEKIKDREDELSARQANLASVNSGGAALLKSTSLTDEDRTNIQRDLDNLNHGWSKLTKDLPQRVSQIEGEIKRIKQLHEEVNTLQQTLVTTRRMQEAMASADQDENSNVEHKKISDTLRNNQLHLNRVNEQYHQFLQSCKTQEVGVPEPLQVKVRKVNSEFKELQDMITAAQYQKREKEVEVVKQEPDEDEPRIVEIMDQAQIVQVESSGRQREAPSTSSWLEFDKSVSELRDWLRLLEHMLRSQKVAVGDIKDIEQMRTKQMTHLTDMEAKEIQVDKVLAASSVLQNSMDNAGDRQTLKERTEKLRLDFEVTREHVNQRKSYLDSLLNECRMFDQSYASLEQWLTQTEAKIDTMESQPGAQDAVTAHEELQEDVDKHQEAVENLKREGERLVDENSTEDTHQVKKQLERLTNRWSLLLNRLTSQWKRLQTSVDSGHQFEPALEEFMTWIEGCDSSFTSLAQQTAAQDLQDNEDLANAFLEQFK
ncbi:dystrophin, partial [Plakobranchus ocellatus]